MHGRETGTIMEPNVENEFSLQSTGVDTLSVVSAVVFSAAAWSLGLDLNRVRFSKYSYAYKCSILNKECLRQTMSM